jgi:preprotein translocase subunit SecF
MENNNLIHTLEIKKVEGMTYVTFFTLIAIAVVIGSILGFGFTKLNKKTNSSSGTNISTQSAGVVDKKTFKDSV